MAKFEGRDLGPLGVPSVEGRIEVQVTGDPGCGYPPYDFTFRSDRDTWTRAVEVATLALTVWPSATIRVRRVQVLTSVTSWRDVGLDDLA